ncbi:hypothetical protein Q8A49_35970, partial [Nocardiopsis umidischolae]|nr:hypothetical protein [Nocardiopsis umidischolae]
GAVGVACSLGSALFAGLTYLINTSAADAISQSITKIDRQTATSRPSERPARTDAPRASALPRRTAGQALEVVGDEIAEQAADFLRSHGGPSERSHEDDRSHEADPPPAADPAETESAQVNPSERPCERERSDGDDEDPERTLTAQERRRMEGQRNRQRIAAYLYRDPDAQTA